MYEDAYTKVPCTLFLHVCSIRLGPATQQWPVAIMIGDRLGLPMPRNIGSRAAQLRTASSSHVHAEGNCLHLKSTLLALPTLFANFCFGGLQVVVEHVCILWHEA